MMLTISLWFFSLAWFATRAADADGPPPATGAPPAAATPLDLTAKLVEIPTKFPPDDLYDYVYVMRYQVVGGAMDGQSILVGHYKPRQPRAGIKDQMKKYVAGKVRSFHAGDVHKLRLAPNLKAIWKGALVDEFAATDRKSVLSVNTQLGIGGESSPVGRPTFRGGARRPSQTIDNWGARGRPSPRGSSKGRADPRTMHAPHQAAATKTSVGSRASACRVPCHHGLHRNWPRLPARRGVACLTFRHRR